MEKTYLKIIIGIVVVVLVSGYLLITKPWRGSINNTNSMETNKKEGLSVGGEGTFNGVDILLESIVADSRCPEGVNCAWVGELAVKIKLKSGDIEQEITLSTLGQYLAGTDALLKGEKTDFKNFSYIFEGHLISISKVEPLRYSDKKIKDSDYVINFAVTNKN